MQVVITGGAGMLGKKLAQELLKRGQLAGPGGKPELIERLLLMDVAAAPDHGLSEIVPRPAGAAAPTRPGAAAPTVNPSATTTEEGPEMNPTETVTKSPKKSMAFKSIQPRALELEGERLIETEALSAANVLPLVIRPAVEGVELVAWARANRRFVEDRLLEHGALLFRGFDVDSAESFESFAAAVCDGDLFNENGEHPRDSVSGKVYTPVFYPPEKQLLWHNENSFNHRWPRKIWFCCMQPAASGGETPLVDSREVYRRLDPALRRPFEDKGVMYVRNYGDGLGLDWRTVFQADTREQAEARLREQHMAAEWKDPLPLFSVQSTRSPIVATMLPAHQVELGSRNVAPFVPRNDSPYAISPITGSEPSKNVAWAPIGSRMRSRITCATSFPVTLSMIIPRRT